MDRPVQNAADNAREVARVPTTATSLYCSSCLLHRSFVTLGVTEKSANLFPSVIRLFQGFKNKKCNRVEIPPGRIKARDR